MNPLSTRPSRWRPITVLNLLVGLLFSLSALGQTINKPGFYIVKGSFNWSEANADALQRGGHLATITSQSEQNAVAALVNGQPGDHFLLGATDSLSEGEWKWITGEPFVYKNWEAGAPNNQNNEDELYILNRSGNVWQDGNSAARTSGGYILEIETEPYQPAFIKEGLVAYYPFNGNANDESGNGNHGIVRGAILTQDRHSIQNSSMRFNGSSTFIEIPSSKSLDSINRITISCWIYADLLFPPQGQQGWKSSCITAKGLRSGEASDWALTIDGDRIRPHIFVNGWNYSDSPSVITKKKWQHVVFSYDGSSTRTYADGVIIKEVLRNVGVLPSSNQPMYIGVYLPESPSNSNFFPGLIDDFRVYNRALTDAEVKAIYDYESTSPIQSPVFVSQPVSQTVNSGDNVVLSVGLQTAGTYNYQWQLNEQNIAGATASSLSVNNAVAGIYRYRVIVSNSAGTVISDTATLTVSTPPAPLIVTQPAPKTVQEGANVSLNVLATGQGALVYQWQFNEQNLPGATSATLNLNGVKLNTAGRYRVLVSSQYGVTISDTVTLTVNANPPPTIVTQPLSRTPAEGTQVSLTVTATGLGSLTYQWQINNQNIPGATSSTLVLSAVRPSANGNYRVIVGNPYGTTISTEATVTVVVIDSDSDGLSDYEELLFGTNSNKADSDGDGLSDSAEVRTHGSNPLTTDTDGDGYSDGIEVARDGNPNNRSVSPTGALAVFPAVDVEFYTLNGVKYQLEVSIDMVSWSAQGGVVVGTGGSQNHLVRASKATQFWRLKVVQ